SGFSRAARLCPGRPRDPARSIEPRPVDTPSLPVLKFPAIARWTREGALDADQGERRRLRGAVGARGALRLLWRSEAAAGAARGDSGEELSTRGTGRDEGRPPRQRAGHGRGLERDRL